ncbi:stage II sporulation protein P [Paenibacillus sp. oral taxon 786 str. D14]|uniref:stage II sporulation protein P n=1 Tax=Paenibacillus sp. oral taxon 786 TaxID=652715 RepID=UPI0001AFCDAA|nr:stage II sporulation protein P [Paenibacillus sp. oral taxon 786]EES73368.1 stage II sporulation protein P [Paenibacillus sp. oral taxon 786 str. D14]
MTRTKLRVIGLSVFLSSFLISLKVIPAYIELNEPKVGTLPEKSQVLMVKEEKIIIQKSSKTIKAEKPNPIASLKNSAVTPTAKRMVQKPKQSEQPRVLIYHTHNRESWLPELQGKTDPNEAFDSKINVTLLGKDLSNKLKVKGMSVIQSAEDYPSKINKFDYAKSYAYSKATLSKELFKHKSIEYVFDIHRDSESKSKTTILYNNVNYAQLYFVVGRDNPNWKQIKKFAARLQNKLNEKIPGISKGIYQKDHSSGNGQYNQSLAEYSALIEIGGVENALEENYRTISILADAIHEIWHEDHNSAI